MKLEKLVNQFRREAMANPKKSVALALMVAVALYFWAPLVWRWVEPADSKRPSRDGSLAIIVTDDPETSQQGSGKRSGRLAWEKVREAMLADRHMQSASFDVAWTNPFAARSEGMQQMPAPSSPELLSPELGPTEAGLALTSVLVGAKRRTATINGETYTEGETVQGTTAAYTFTIRRISRYGVSLERAGRVFPLELTPTSLASGDAIRRTGQETDE